ncbi:MAG TPA: M13 family metallopeptidase [Verrucomicrobiae bacterium]|nr:M13 family metallopeptidase [Verrucomicrobiae bacterium]
MTLQTEITPSINPGDDFYGYVNQKWLDSHPIPADKSRYSTFVELDDRVTEQLHKVLQEPVLKDEPRNCQLAKRFYASGMDEARIEVRSFAAIRPFIREAEAVASVADIKALITKRHAQGRGLVWRLNIDVDEKNCEHYIMSIGQGGILLPNRDYYFEKGKQFTETRAAYKEFLKKLFELLDKDKATTRARNVYAIEKQLAAASNTSIENRDVEAKYNPFSFVQLAQEFTGFDWLAYQKTIGLEKLDGLIVQQPKFLGQAVSLLDSQSVKAWQDYFIVHSFVPYMPYLGKKFEDVYFAFFGTVLTGVERQEDRYKRVIDHTTYFLPEPAGQLYVEAHFDKAAKDTITDLVRHVSEALRKRITNLDWMSDTTKQKALEKLDTFMPLLGYPDKWRSYESLEIGGDYIENVLAIIAFDWQYDIGRVTKPVDRREWLMSPATVNAYYWPNTNGITFPAAILQPPAFDAQGDFAANYGAIGVVIGHEITHGFDDKGSKYDKIGNLNSWWSEEDRKAFDKRTTALVEQYDQYVIDGKHVKGALTLGENIADLAGILIAFDALQQKLQESGERDSLDGFTPEQRFFLAQARFWRMNIRPKLTLQLLVRDPHSPQHLRVNGVVPNMDAWYEAWHVKKTDKLYKTPDKRIRIW